MCEKRCTFKKVAQLVGTRISIEIASDRGDVPQITLVKTQLKQNRIKTTRFTLHEDELKAVFKNKEFIRKGVKDIKHHLFGLHGKVGAPQKNFCAIPLVTRLNHFSDDDSEDSDTY